MLPAIASILTIYAIARLVQTCVEHLPQEERDRSAMWGKFAALVVITLVASVMILLQWDAVISAARRVNDLPSLR